MVCRTCYLPLQLCSHHVLDMLDRLDKLTFSQTQQFMGRIMPLVTLCIPDQPRPQDLSVMITTTESVQQDDPDMPDLEFASISSVSSFDETDDTSVTDPAPTHQVLPSTPVPSTSVNAPMASTLSKTVINMIPAPPATSPPAAVTPVTAASVAPFVAALPIAAAAVPIPAPVQAAPIPAASATVGGLPLSITGGLIPAFPYHLPSVEELGEKMYIIKWGLDVGVFADW